MAIDTGYRPRKQQEAIHDLMAEKRFVVVVAHRRMGKTVSAVNELIHCALECDLPNPRFAYVAPTYGQAKRVAWDYLLDYTRPLKAIKNSSELRIDFHNGKRISLYGADNPDSLRGIYLDGVIIDEIADVNPSIFNEILRPALSDRMGWCMFIGTPKGNNHFKELRDRALESPEGWGCLEFRASQTGLIPDEELKAAKREMGEDKYAQEFECSFDASIEGSYYGKILNELQSQGRMTDIVRDDLCKTWAAWDLGMGDSTAIWIAQTTGQEIRIVDYYENNGESLDHYVNWLRNNNWFNATQLLPHDVQVRELGTGKSRKEMLEETGLEINIVSRLSVDDGIMAVRRMLPKCWFDKKTTKGLEALKNYRKEFDERRNLYNDKPLHDWCSHAADAFRYLAVGMDNVDSTWSKPLQVNNSWVV